MRLSNVLYGLAFAIPMVFGAAIPLEKRHHDINAAKTAEVYSTNHFDVSKRGHDAPDKALDFYDWPHIAVSKRRLVDSPTSGDSTIDKRDHASQANSFGTEVYQSNHVDVGKRDLEPYSHDAA